MNNLVKTILLSANVLIICTFISFFVNAKQSEKLPELKLPEPPGHNEYTVTKENQGKTIISIINFGRSNPFEPYKPPRKITVQKNEKPAEADDIPYPPTLEGEADPGYKLLTNSKVNGILYDPDDKSVAIITIEDKEFMMHKGDKVRGVTVKNIEPKSVTLQYGTNIYIVGVGEVVEGAINYDEVERKGNTFAQTGYKLPDINPEESTKQ